MARIARKDRYPIKNVPVADDYVIGTDSQNNNKTVSFSIASLLGEGGSSILGENIPKLVNFGSVSSEGAIDSVHDKVNQLDLFEVGANELLVLTGIVFESSRSPVSFIDYYLVNGKGKGTYGEGGDNVVEESDLIRIEREQIGSYPTIPIFAGNAYVEDLGEIGTDVLLTLVNEALPAYNILEGQDWYFEFTRDGRRELWGFAGVFGIYGLGQAQATSDELFLVYDESLVLTPVNTSDLNNDGEDGSAPFITADDLPAEIENTSELFNDGADGINPFISRIDVYEVISRNDITLDGSAVRINGNPMTPSKFYLINDFSNTQYVAGSNETEVFVGAAEEVFIQAISEDSLAPIAYSKTYPEEVLTIIPEIKDLYNDSFAKWLTASGNDVANDFDITVTTSTVFNLNSIAIVSVAADEDIIVTVQNDRSATWTGSFNDGDFTFDPATQTFDLSGSTADSLLLSKVTLTVTYRQTLSEKFRCVVTNRSVPSKNIDIDADFRNTRYRRFKSTAPDWSAGIYVYEDVVKRDGNLFAVSVNSTSVAPTEYGLDWIFLGADDYLFPENFEVNGFVITNGSTDYQDKSMFTSNTVDGSTSGISIKSADNGLDDHFSPSINIIFDTSIGQMEAVDITSYYNYPVTIDGGVKECTFKGMKNVYMRGSQFKSTVNSIEDSMIVGSISSSTINELGFCITKAILQSSINLLFESTFRGAIKATRASNILSCKISAFYFESNDINVMQNTTVLGNFFRYNTLKGLFSNNLVNNAFQSNIMVGTVQYNTFTVFDYNSHMDASFTGNTFTGGIYNNFFMGGVNNNNTAATMRGNHIKNSITGVNLTNSLSTISGNIINSVSSLSGGSIVDISANYIQDLTSVTVSGSTANQVRIKDNFMRDFSSLTLTNDVDFLNNRILDFNGGSITDAEFSGNKSSDSIINTTLLANSAVTENTFNGVMTLVTFDTNVEITASHFVVALTGTISTDYSDTYYGQVIVSLSMKSGATQILAGAEAGELWKTVSHATLPDNVVLVGV